MNAFESLKAIEDNLDQFADPDSGDCAPSIKTMEYAYKFLAVSQEYIGYDNPAITVDQQGSIVFTYVDKIVKVSEEFGVEITKCK